MEPLIRETMAVTTTFLLMTKYRSRRKINVENTIIIFHNTLLIPIILHSAAQLCVLKHVNLSKKSTEYLHINK